MSDADRARWDKTWSQRAGSEPAAAVVALERWLPAQGRAVDLAGGAGRHSIWLAQHGLDVTWADVSPVGAGLVARGAQEAGVAVNVVVHDLDAGCVPGPWDVVLIHHFLDRALLRGLRAHMAVGGRVLMVHPTVGNLERHARPSKRFLLEAGELPGLFEGFETLHHEEGWTAEGRHEAVFVGECPLIA